ncbi:MAG: S8 family serine peptidase [Verrucomicrobiota bacterium]
MFPVFARCISSLLVCALGLTTAAAAQKTIRLRNEQITTTSASSSTTKTTQALSATASSLNGLFVIQFESAPTSAQREELTKLGVDLLSYVPDDAFIADVSNVSLAQLRTKSFIHWVGSLQPEHKIHAKLTNRSTPQSKLTGDLAVSVLLAPRPLANEAATARNQFTHITGQTELRQGTILRGGIPAAKLQQLAESRAVLWIEPAPQMKLRDEIATKIVAGDDGEAGTLASVHQLGYTGAGVTVAVADSGLDSGDTNSMHPDIAGRVTALFAYGALDDAADEHSHGTHCAGIIAGNGATGEVDDNGFLYGLGIAPGANLIGQRLFDGAGGYTYTNASFERLTRDAKLAGADIGSNSWGDDTQGRYDLSAMEFDALVRDAVSDAFAAGDQPYILEFSAGNAGPGEQTIGSPAVAKNVIATGAAQNDRPDLLVYGDGPDAMADFSSRGPCEDGRIKPDVTAPGTWIASLRSIYADDNNAWGEISANYMYQGGTSQAGPHVSGAAAVFVQFWRQTHTNATPSPALVKAALVNSATDMNETALGSTGVDEDGEPIDVGFPQEANPVPNNDEGWGRVDLTNLIGTTKDYLFVDQTVLLTNDQVFEQRILIANANEPLKITLTYTDVPGTPLTVPALVNDLDLEVVAPDGHVYRGNQFNAGESIADAPDFDRINNVEAVHLTAPVAGEYLVRIRAHNLPMDARRDSAAVDQDFALVVSGRFAPPGTGIVTFDRRVYTAPATINLRLVDYNLAGQPTVTITLRSTAEPNGEIITLLASGTTGSFTGTVATATGTAVTDGVLQIQHSNTITAVYQDAAPPAQRLFTAQADLLPPAISGLFTTNRFGKTQVHWRTDEPARSLLLYGTNASLGLIQTNSLLQTNHIAIADGQVSGQTNYFALVCIDEASNRTTNNNAGQLFKYVVPFAPPILVVDAYFADLIDPPPPIENYTDILNTLAVGYDVWNVETQGSPTAADLRAYRVVLWRIAEFSTSTPTGLTTAQQSALRSYLDSGGALFIASMELISRLGLTSPFVKEVLHVSDFTEDVSQTAVEGVPNDAIGNGIATDLDYSDYLYFGIIELNYSDTITPGPGAEGILTDPDTSEFTGLSFPRIGVDSPGRNIFLSFPFDAMPVAERTTFLGRALQFLAPGLNGRGNVTFNQSAYASPSQATVEVADSDLEGVGQININLTSTTQTTPASLTLQETLRRGVFRGTFAIVPALTGGSPVELRAVPGNLINASYFDVSANLTRTASAPVENTPPDVTDVTVEAGYVDAIVAWETDELADSQVEFGESILLGRSALDATPTYSHAVSLPQLQPARTYYFRIVTKDRAGNLTVDDNGGDLYTFTTLQPRQPPWTDNMEGTSTNWTVYTVEDSERGWELGVPGILSPPAHSPTNAWGSNLSGDYASAIESYLISPAIQLTNGSTVTLRFWHAYDFTSPSEYDIMHAGEVLLLTDNALEPISLGVFSDDIVDWEQVQIDLTPHAGKIVYIAWHYFLFSLDSLPRTGWLVDDVSITAVNPTTGTLIILNNLWQSSFTLSGVSTHTGTGRRTVITNAAAGAYNLQYGAVPYFTTPANQTSNLAAGQTLTFTGNYTFTDTNTNGLPDAYETEKFGALDSTRTQATDTDQDGLSDWAEFIAGTDPVNPPPPFRLTAQRLTNNLIRLAWPSVANHTYRVHASNNTTTWLPASSTFAATGTNTTYTFATTTNGAVKFFRVEATPPASAVAGIFKVTATVLSSQQIRLDWPSAPGHGYRVLGSTNLVTWTPYTDWIRTAGYTANQTLPPRTNGAPNFFRLEAQP